jgi:hypothetical protein
MDVEKYFVKNVIIVFVINVEKIGYKTHMPTNKFKNTRNIKASKKFIML